LNTGLIQILHRKIDNHGPQSFAWFMEEALYHPEHGFYSSGRAAIGRHGDYFTNVSVGSLFGELLTAQFAQIWSRLGKIDNFVIVEQGAHHGEFAHDVLDCADRSYPEFSAGLRYEIVEPFPRLQDRQLQALKQFGDRVKWRRSIEDVQPFVGIHFSNELLDSFPVHMVVSTGDGWLEKMVGLSGKEFVFVEQPIRDPELENFVERLPQRPCGYHAEVNLAALDWVAGVSKRLKRGCVLVVDYGFAREQLYDADRTAGTLQVRMQHRRLDSPFQEIGSADMTAHIDWTSLAQSAEQSGFHLTGFTDQHHFLTGILSESANLPKNRKDKQALQTLLHPEMLGRAFQVLALEKDAEVGPLSGFKFARDARATLGL
jgi:SAM-dependent MidA family methyltransferase